MKRLLAVCAIVVIALSLTGCLEKEYRLYWGAEAGTKKARGVETWVERSVYYAIADSAYGTNLAYIKLAAEDGTEPTSGVKWALSNPLIGEFDHDYPPSRRAIMPAAAGEGIISAEYDGNVETSRFVVFPSAIVTPTQGLDVDGDGTIDVILIADKTGISFPYGVQHYLPIPFPDFFVDANALGDMPDDIEWPEDNPTVFNTDGVRIVYFKASTGALYAAHVRRGETLAVFGWRKLRDVA